MVPFHCYHCGSSEYLVMADRDKIRHSCYGLDKKVLKCNNCKLVQIHPMLTREERNYLFKDYSNKKPFTNYKKVSFNSGKILEQFIYDKREVILDVGMGDGGDYNYLKNKGYRNVVGLDKDETVCSSKDGCILNCDFMELESSIGYDFIYARRVLNYIDDPKAFFNKLHSLLEQGGRFFVEIANYQDALTYLYRNKPFRYFKYEPFNCFYYDGKTIKYMIDDKKFNYKVELIQNYGLLNHLNWIWNGKPSNGNDWLPVIDHYYKSFLQKIGFTDRIYISGFKK